MVSWGMRAGSRCSSSAVPCSGRYRARAGTGHGRGWCARARWRRQDGPRPGMTWHNATPPRAPLSWRAAPAASVEDVAPAVSSMISTVWPGSPSSRRSIAPRAAWAVTCCSSQQARASRLGPGNAAAGRAWSVLRPRPVSSGCCLPAPSAARSASARRWCGSRAGEAPGQPSRQFLLESGMLGMRYGDGTSRRGLILIHTLT